MREKGPSMRSISSFEIYDISYWNKDDKDCIFLRHLLKLKLLLLKQVFFLGFF